MKAFPTKNCSSTPAWIDNSGNQGMDLRDYFAIKLYPIAFEHWKSYYFSSENDDEVIGEYFNYQAYDTLIAEMAYEMAEEMMVARKAKL
jgi:hypothetical protein